MTARFLRTGAPVALPILLLATLSAAAAPPRTVFLVPVGSEPSWRDDAFLVAVPAAVVAGRGEPLVCAVEPSAPWRPELLDFLRRYEPDRVVWLGPDAPGATPEGVRLERVAADSASAAARAITQRFFAQCERAVAYDPADRAAALAAAVLAARLRVPLLPAAGAALAALLNDLGIDDVIAVGAPPRDLPEAVRVETLNDALAVAARLGGTEEGVDYLAVVHPHDGPAGAPRVAGAAVVLAAGRRGAVVPLPFDAVWKRCFPAGEPGDAAPEGAHASRSGHRLGEVDVGRGPQAFATGIAAADGKAFVQVDLDGDGRFAGPDEAPVRTGGILALGGRDFVVDLDVDEKARGRALWLTAPTPEALREHLAAYRAALPAEPRYLCLVGWPDQVPLAILRDGDGIDADVVSDHPYAQTDADPFFDVAFARFVAEDAASGTLQACRGLAVRAFDDQSFAGTFATAEWASDERAALERAGLRCIGHHAGGAPITADSPLTRAGAIVHGAHAMWTVLGETYTWDSDVLLAPCLVESSGCSTASLDQDPERRSVAARMLRNGALAFAGNARRGIAQSALHRSELWNALWRGASLGEAHRDALNRVLVAVLERGETQRGYRYQLDHSAVYGDPALTFGFELPEARRLTRVESRGRRATVVAPPPGPPTVFEPLAEWGCAAETLHAWRVPGMGTECRWHPAEKRNAEDLLFTAEVRTRLPVIGVEPIRPPEGRLGWTGTCYVDEHADGSRSVLWRCRLVDFDMNTGEVLGALRRLDFRLRTR